MRRTPPTRLGQHALAALVLEVSARKAGNVHPQAAYEDCSWQDFVASALVTSSILARTRQLGVGPTILECVTATRQVVASNTNLGMVLLLAPMAAAGDARQMPATLARLTGSDARAVYQAIALARPGGLGKSSRGDVEEGDVLPLLEAMALAAERDAIARQYATGFSEIFALAEYLAAAAKELPLDDAIVRTHLHQMALQPDTLIARKNSRAIARQSQKRAQAVLDARWPGGTDSHRQMESLDRWLRADGNRLNPGASADLVAAALFAGLCSGSIKLPHRWRENLWS